MTTKLNPIQERIATGMSPLIAFLTEATCGDACWSAREDVCRCSCGGKNHGCMRDESGQRPERTAKIDGYRYVLKAADVQGIYGQARDMNKAAGPYRVEPFTATTYDDNNQEVKVQREYKYWWSETMKGAPARVKLASRDQVAKWPELAAWREGKRFRPYLLWVREDRCPKPETTIQTQTEIIEMPKAKATTKTAKTKKAKAKTTKTTKTATATKVVAIDRSAAAKRAWETIRANKLKAKAA